MRIYPSKHKIKSIPTSKIDTDLNIPLAYISVDYTKYDISKIVEPDFSTTSKSILYPEQKFENKNFLLFNEFEEEVSKNNLFVSTNNGYMFYPSNTVKFSPKKFSWKATVKKNYDYNISNTYNIKVGYEYDTVLNRNLINTFMNPSERDMYVYSNIKINSNDKTYNTFELSDDTDIMFIKSHNCKHFDVNNTREIKINDYLSKHTNIWFGCEDAVALNETYKMLTATTPHTFRIKNPIISENAVIDTKYYFDLNTISTPTGVIMHNIFDTTLVPALILEYTNQGFIVITSYTIFDDMNLYEKFMYEIMMYVYCNTYMSTDYNEEWITYSLPNYEVTNNVYTTKSSFISKKSISSQFDSQGSYNLINIDIVDDTALDAGLETAGSIKCIGQNNGKPVFVIDGKLNGYTEPNKPEGWKSIYCNGYIYYIDKLYYLIEQDITNKIMMVESDTDLIIKLYNFKSSKYEINKQTDTTLKISFIKTDGELIQRIREAEYTVFYNKDNSMITYCYAEDYEDKPNLYKLFNILVQQTDDAIEVYDMRQLGGGLSEEEEDDFELVDIGHINGRPYRIAGTLVLTMPTKYKPYEQYIQKALDKYKTAEDYIAVFFEDKEDDDN